MKDLSASAWNERYLQGITPWDLTGPCPQILQFTKEVWFPRHGAILFPGAGRGHDAIALAQLGYSISAVDFAKAALEELLRRAKEYGQTITVFKRDFFSLYEDPYHRERYDVILEYTFFCAINPALRKSYIDIAHRLLRPKGYFAGIFFPTAIDKEPPPFMVDQNEVVALFKENFSGQILEPTHSIQPRKGREFLGIFQKK